MKQNRLGSTIWISILMFGLFGQIAWMIENTYFNLFLYNTISGDPAAIAWMVAASAITATLTTMVMGALSDKVGKRKIFICAGYILWGLTTIVFGFISTDAIVAILPSANAIAIAVFIVILLDCVMTFFGSTANDGAFNAWITDVTQEDNRAKVEGVLAVLPLIAMLLIFGVFDGFTQAGNWKAFFFILGGIISFGGIVGIFLIKDSVVHKPKGHYWEELIFGFRPSTIKTHPVLYLFLAIYSLFSIAVQIYMPYFIIYIQRYLGINEYAILLGIVLLLASVISIVVSRFIHSKNERFFFFPSILTMCFGLILLFLARTPAFVVIAGIVMMSGNLVFSAVVNARIRDLTPKENVGHFQGIRMIFYVLIPMVIGPFIGSAVIKNSNMTYVDLGVIKQVPTPAIFLASAIALLVILIPLYFTLRKSAQKTIALQK